MIYKSFDTYPRDEIALARDNLAEVAAFVFLDEEQSVQHRFHVIGNLILAAAATAERISPVSGLEADLETVLIEGGLSQEKSAQLAVGTRDLSHLIFPLRHIPDQAPEIIIGKKSRELNVGKFVSEARKLNPNRQPNPNITGFGNQMFIGSYIRKLS